MPYVASRKFDVTVITIAKAGITTNINNIYWLDYGDFYHDSLALHRDASQLLLHREREAAEFQRKLRDGKVFIAVREPLKRAYSCFNEKAATTHKYAFPWLARLLRDRGASLGPEDDLATHRADFLIFLRFVAEDVKANLAAIDEVNPHWRPQFFFLRAALQRRAPDMMGRTETLSEDFELFLKHAGVDAIPPRRRFNEGPKPRFDYADVAGDDEVLSVGEALFARDYRILGYRRPSETGVL